MNGATLQRCASRQRGFPCCPSATPLTRPPAQRFLSCRTLWAYPGRHPPASSAPRERPTTYLEPVAATGFCSSPPRWRPVPAAACSWTPRLGSSESSSDHSASARTSTSPYLSTASLVWPMCLAARALTRARVCNHLAPKPALLQRLLPTLLQHHWLLLV